MASCDGGRVAIEYEGAIRVFGIGGQTGKVNVAGFSQLGLRRLSGIHGGLKGICRNLYGKEQEHCVELK